MTFISHLNSIFSKITHLSIDFAYNWRQTLKESILKDIDIYLPKIQYFKICSSFDTTSEGVTQMADILSRLSRLEAIHLKFKSGVDLNAFEEQINKKCRKIKEIKIYIESASGMTKLFSHPDLHYHI